MDSPPAAAPLRVVAAIVDGPLSPHAEADALSLVDGARCPGLAGAVLRFEGIVRRAEADRDRDGVLRPLEALDYQTYDPMAQREFEALARGVAERHGLLSLVALHSRGRVRVGEVSFVLVVAAAHRAEAVAGLTGFIDRLKQDVPIWKRPVWA